MKPFHLSVGLVFQKVSPFFLTGELMSTFRFISNSFWFFKSFFSSMAYFVVFFSWFNKCEPFLLSNSRSPFVYFLLAVLTFLISVITTFI